MKPALRRQPCVQTLLGLFATWLILVVLTGCGSDNSAPASFLGPSGVQGTAVLNPPTGSNAAPTPLANAPITIQDLGGNQVASQATDGQGHYSIALAPGTYQIIPQAFGNNRPTARSQTIVIKGGEFLTFNVGYTASP